MTAAIGHTWSAFSRSSALLPSGPLQIASASGVLRHMGVDACQLSTPYSPDAYGRLAPGCGALLYRDGRQVFSGMVGSQRRITWDSDRATANITVQLLGDDQHLADRLVWPSPNRSPYTQLDDYWQYTGPASTAMRNLISEQAGPSAYEAQDFFGYPRAVSGLTLGADPNVGTSRLWREQWANLLDTLSAWSVLSGLDLGIRLTTVSGGVLRADVYVPRDLSAGVRFSANLTNLTGWDYVEQPPSVITAITAGSGDLAARLRQVEYNQSVRDLAWGRLIEQYIDQRQETDPYKLWQASADAVAQGHGTQSLALSPIDSKVSRWGTDWELGDRVTVHVGLPGGPTVATVVDLVREVAFEVSGNGAEKITPAVGTTDAKAVRPGWSQEQIADVAAGLARLNRNK